MLTAVIIPINGLTSGKYTFNFTCEQPFFDQFGNQDIRDAHIETVIVLEKESSHYRLDINIHGSVVRSCDRCLGDVSTHISFHAPIIVEFSNRYSKDEGDEIILLSPAATQIDLTQYVYDSVCVNLPLQSIHPIGACDPVMEQKLAEHTINYQN